MLVKLVVFGASGPTGRQVVSQGLAQGHMITAFVRNPGSLQPASGLNIVQGDIVDAAAVAQAIRGQDAALSALGTRSGPAVLPEGTRNIVSAMEDQGVRRFICVSSVGVGDSKAQLGPVVRWLIVGVFLRDAIAEKERQEEVIRGSHLDWTIARPGGLEDGPLTGRYRCLANPQDKISGRPVISRADVADFMLKQLTSDEYRCRSVSLLY
jgi:putative NADH-flavin reductase